VLTRFLRTNVINSITMFLVFPLCACVNSLQKRLKVPFRDGSSKDEALSSTFPHNAGKGNSRVWEISVNTFGS